MKISFPVSHKAFFTILLYAISFSGLTAQQKPLHFVINENISPQKCLDLTLENPATSLTIQFPAENHHDKFFIYADGEKYIVSQDVDVDEKDGKVFSQLAVFPKAVSRITICAEEFSGEIDLHFLQVPYIKFEKNAFKQPRYKKGCEKPVTVDQEIWRVELNPPTIKPAPNKVTHIIVHHTATSNTDSNYINVMRNIYLYHTEVNGWDDIGYNFLVAPDGVIFQGRDGQGVDEDDNVIGAHFCAKNTNTMGISIIGNYQTVPPTDTALRALENLIAWKLNKENLGALDTVFHRVETLHRISGHRDGCATECPGDSVYARLPQIRLAVNMLMEDCTPPTVNLQEPKHFSAKVDMDFNQASNQLIIKSESTKNYTFMIVDMQGKTWKTGVLNSEFETISVNDLPKGTYILQLYHKNEKNALKFVKY